MRRRLPAIAYVLGLAGLIPFIACGLGAVAGSDPVEATRSLTALVGYGAVILSFVGGAHWGFVLGEPEGGAAKDPAGANRRVGYRLSLGVAPSLVGWLALLILPGLPDVSLIALLAGFVAFPVAEADLRRRDLIPAGYMVLRWALSIAVALLLATVLVLRLIGGRVIF